MPHQQPDDSEWAIDVEPSLVTLCAHPLVVDALYVQQVAAVHAHFCYLQEGSGLVLVSTLLKLCLLCASVPTCCEVPFSEGTGRRLAAQCYYKHAASSRL